MSQLSNKIQIPIKTKIAFVIIFLVGLVVEIRLVGIMGSDVCSACESAWCSFPFIQFFYFLLCSQLWLMGVFLCLGVFGFILLKNIMRICSFLLAFIFLLGVPILLISGMTAKDNLLISISAVAIAGALVLLVIDRKNYFAAVEKAKKGNNGLTK